MRGMKPSSIVISTEIYVFTNITTIVVLVPFDLKKNKKNNMIMLNCFDIIPGSGILFVFNISIQLVKWQYIGLQMNLFHQLHNMISRKHCKQTQDGVLRKEHYNKGCYVLDANVGMVFI